MAHYFERKVPLRCLYDGDSYQSFLYFLKSFHGLWCEVKFNFFTKEGCERSSGFAEILYEPHVKSGMPEKFSHVLTFVKLGITSIFARSTSIPAADTLCPRTIPSFTMKWHFSQFRTRFFSSHIANTLRRLSRQF